jgi:hypothetical protein
MQQKQAVYRGLQFVPVLFEDQSLTSPDYFQITEFPTRLTAGKNLFKLRGHPTNLTTGGALGIEVLDFNGDPIYSEVVDFIDEDKSRIIAIYIYKDTPPGDCTITLVAEASVIQGVPTPAEYKGQVNVRWSRTVAVNPLVANNSEIIFENLPSVKIQEQVGVQLDRQYTETVSIISQDTNTITTQDGILLVNQNDVTTPQFPTYDSGSVKFFVSDQIQPTIELIRGVDDITTENNITLQAEDGITLIGTQTTSVGLFIDDMEGGTITVNNPADPSPTPSYPIILTSFVSTIKKILTPTTALLDSNYTAFSSESIFPHTYNEFGSSAYSISYEASPTYTETQDSQSFALIEIEGLEPATGDISRTKVFTNNNGTIGTFELVNDVELEETEIFVPSTSSILPDVSVGIFVSQSTIDTYWEGHTYISNTESTAPTLTLTSTLLNSSVLISSSADITADDHVLTFQTKNEYQGVFIATSSYKVTFDALGTRNASSNNKDPLIGVYMSGSAFNYDSTDLFNQNLPVKLGKRIGEIRSANDSRRFDDQVFNFETDNSGHGTIIFVVESGVWQIANVRTTTDNDPGYTPNYTRLKTFIETTHKIDNQISFKIEYYNVDGVASKQTTFVYDQNWQGGNRYIDGDFSMLTGSLFVADSLNSGVAISGLPNAGFIRSLDYQGFESGFPGFLLFSGSALPGQNTKGGVPYSGVGLELYAHTASYFRYSTTDSEIDIRTNKFFFGNISGSFISGSNGLLEISSSNFSLDSNGFVTAGNFSERIITIDDDNSGSFLRHLNGSSEATGSIDAQKNIVLDGSLGGTVMMNCVLDVTAGFIIKDIEVANTGSNTFNDVDIIIQTAGMRFDDTTINPSARGAYIVK